MTGRIDVEFDLGEGAMLRVLGLVERRGFEVRGMTMRERGQGGSLRLDVRARDTGRRLDVIAGHLRRLVDVRAVSVSNQEFRP